MNNDDDLMPTVHRLDEDESTRLVDEQLLGSKTANDFEENVDVKETVSTFNNRKASPVAQAFFAALDLQERGEEEGNSPHQVGCLQRRKENKSSLLIQKQIQTLGWRNRYSQSEYYPFTINMNVTANNAASSTNTITATKFHVRQVQCGEIHNTYGTGATVWPASIVLIRYLQRLINNNDVRLLPPTTKITDDGHSNSTYNIIDLGCGTGIMTIALAILFGNISNRKGIKPHIICTDGEFNVVQLAKDNIKEAMKEANQQNKKLNDKNNDLSSTSSLNHMTTQARMDYLSNKQTDTTLMEPIQATKEDEDSNDDVEKVYYVNNCSIEVQKYWWGSGSIRSQVMKDVSAFDLIVVSDCVLPKLYPIEPLIDAIDQLIGQSSDDIVEVGTLVGPNSVNNGTASTTSIKKKMAILSYEYRYYESYDPKQYVIDLCQKKHLHLEVIPIEEQDPIYSIPDDVEVWHIYRK